MSNAYKNTRTSHAAEDSAVLGHAGHTWPEGTKSKTGQCPNNTLIDKHPEINENLHRAEWSGNTLQPAGAHFDANGVNINAGQQNLTAANGLQTGHPAVSNLGGGCTSNAGSCGTGTNTASTTGGVCPKTGATLANAPHLPSSLQSDIISHGGADVTQGTTTYGSTNYGSTTFDRSRCGTAGCGTKDCGTVGCGTPQFQTFSTTTTYPTTTSYSTSSTTTLPSANYSSGSTYGSGSTFDSSKCSTAGCGNKSCTTKDCGTKNFKSQTSTGGAPLQGGVNSDITGRGVLDSGFNKDIGQLNSVKRNVEETRQFHETASDRRL